MWNIWKVPTLIGTIRLRFQRTLLQLLPLPADKGRLGLSLSHTAHPELRREMGAAALGCLDTGFW